MLDLIKRTVSGAIFIAVVTSCLLLGKFSFAALILLLIVLTMNEFYKITMGKNYCFSQILSIIAAAILFIFAFAYKGLGLPGRLVILAVIPIFIVMVNSLYVKEKKEFGRFANLYTAILYIAVPLSLTNYIVFNPEEEYNGKLLLCLFILIWASDVGGYIFGMTLGQKFGKKLWPEISPKKSWIGFWGGIFFSIVSSVLMNVTGLLPYPMIHCVLMAIIMDIMGVYGDLVESQWKRHYLVKDSGHIMPGHGGMLDRLDSALFAIPAGAIYLVVLNVL